MMFTCKIIASYNRQFSADSTMNDYKIDSCFVVALGPKNRVTKHKFTFRNSIFAVLYLINDLDFEMHCRLTDRPTFIE